MRRTYLLLQGLAQALDAVSARFTGSAPKTAVIKAFSRDE
jgi:hypothetical protein